MASAHNLKSPGHTAWVEGLRGIAAMFVVTSHISVAYASFLEAPRQANHSAQWYNAPFIRVFAEGSPWVTVFLVLTGYVNALKPIRQIRAGRSMEALTTMANSCFRRPLRLFLPCTVATMFAWILAELGAFRTGAMAHSSWMVSTCPNSSKNSYDSVRRLLTAIIDTWMFNTNELERHQWPMLYFLKGSLATAMFLMATLNIQPRFRLSLSALLILYGWRSMDAVTFMPVFSGLFLAEMSTTSLPSRAASSSSSPIQSIPYILMVGGWYCISYPNRLASRMSWSDGMYNLATALFPENADYHDHWNQIGVTMILSAIILSTTFQRILNAWQLQWLGVRSFAIYLVHGPVLRSFMNWMLFFDAEMRLYDEKDDTGKKIGAIPMFPIPPLQRFYWAVPVFFAVLLFLADYWYKRVEPFCATLANRIEHLMLKEDDTLYPAYTLKEAFGDDLQSGSPFIASPLSRATTPLNEVESLLPR